MELTEYLVQQLSVSIEEAEKIAKVVKEYHHTYGPKQHQKPQQKSLDGSVNAPFHLIMESEEYAKTNNYDLSKLHCNGCDRHCPLDNPNCGRGKMTAQLIRNLL